jgi:hypothetical protein
MTLGARHELFGDPSDSLVPESVFAFHSDNGTWPMWEEARADLCQWKTITKDEAESRILTAIRDGEVLARLRGPLWMLELDQDHANKIARRYLDMSLKRKENAP